MPLGKHLKLLIHADGTCSVDAVNFADATCTRATQEIMQALGGQAVSERFKPQAQRLPPQAVRQEAGR
ncbi:MAG: DUF2997 domain-containing protein [Armatimonadetes bacterium]|nr:DUF2997 domain-containing protein [Armatimonadota bacterium]